MLYGSRKLLIAAALGACALAGGVSAQAGGYYGPGPYGAPPAYGPGYGPHPMHPPMYPPPRAGMSRPGAQGSGQAPAEESVGASADEDGNAAAVSIRGMRFVPSTVRIQAGETVTWEQRDRMPHLVEGSGEADFASTQLSAGESYSHTFEEPGTYDYYCSIHPGMRGTVVVE